MLATLLVRVNARHVTQSLSLLRSYRMRGYGLAPLSFSRVLENVRLFRVGALDEKIAVSNLRIMNPYRLCHVRFGKSSSSGAFS